LIGLNSKGESLRNGSHGVILNAMANENLIGVEVVNGNLAGTGNVISGNGLGGVIVLGNKNRVAGNFIGTDAKGDKLGNGFTGVLIQGSENRIGGPMKGQGNVIGNNAGDGILINQGGQKNHIQGNFIGVDPQDRKIGNKGNGVVISGSSDKGVPATAFNTIGGVLAGERNVISDNGANGVKIEHKRATKNRVLNNHIGTNVGGTMAIGNKDGIGVWIQGAPDNFIGEKGAGNVISGNTRQGVTISESAATGNSVVHNLIGTDATGMKPLGNGTTDPKIVASGVWIDDADRNLIAENVISANGLYGVAIGGEPNDKGAGNQVLKNLIGTDKNGSNKNAALLNKEGPAVSLRKNSKDNKVEGNTLAIPVTLDKKFAILDDGTGNVKAGNTILGGKSALRGDVTIQGGGEAVALLVAANGSGPAAGIGWSLQRPPAASPALIVNGGRAEELDTFRDAALATIASGGRARRRDTFFAQDEGSGFLVGLANEPD
jgi:hypothetical protein